MSIFPKRTVRNSTVTIHWNYNTSGLTSRHIYPFVRIGVQAPDGTVTMLMEKHILALPPVMLPPAEAGPVTQKNLYLNKNTPLLVLADYLSGAHSRETLVNILQHIQNGRHYYFTYTIPADAPLGKYTLLSELYNEGQVKYSKTAADDCFWVESVTVSNVVYEDGAGSALLQNQCPEPVPVRVVQYHPGHALLPQNVTAFELPARAKHTVSFASMPAFLLYNEERVCIPLVPQGEPVVLRNQQWISVSKNTGSEPAVYLMAREGDAAITLTGVCLQLWNAADGLTARHTLQRINGDAYDEMLLNGLLHELNP
ncbi:hypothetical protein HNQ91_003595 [Filimonas zeae]|uniref:Uncharacterized protein n=1 Tax=Filimonas zeae TaxID=1737353 RepID=A0A917MXG0_9BACT|nr:hypothetical protein [Filimonas zeae]MDR6340530.1 hypothetical protein [Filimonas zeae]GGH73178.1 hypothetical protein GCM10011379_34400 [Filimonas zeae]